MLLTILISVLTLLSVIIDVNFIGDSADSGILAGVMGFIYLFFMMCLLISRRAARQSIVGFKAARQTISRQRRNARANGSSTYHELDSIARSIINYNVWLAQEQNTRKSKWISVFSLKEIEDFQITG